MKDFLFSNICLRDQGKKVVGLFVDLTQNKPSSVYVKIR